MNRFIAGVKEIPHAFVDFFVRPLKIWFPQPVTFWRSDNQEGLLAKRRKPWGYWLGHLVAYVVVGALVVYLVMHGEPPPTFVDE